MYRVTPAGATGSRAASDMLTAGIKAPACGRLGMDQSCSIIAAAAETVAWPGLSSTFSVFTTPSSTSME